ncbi:MAG: peptidoglycan-binding protein [Bacteroidota bacterium]
MPTPHTVQAGECVTSIAEQYGFPWDTVWNDPANDTLRDLRQDPNTLVAGDIVTIPDKRPKQVSVATDQTHTFRKKGIPATCRLQLFDGYEYRANQAYTLEIDGTTHTGFTDEEGVLEVPIEGDAKQGRLVVGPDEMEMTFLFGHLEPVTTVAGQKARLNNLGFDAGDPSSGEDEQLEEALAAFQTHFGLEVTGDDDEATRAKLLEFHDDISDLEEEEPPPEDEEALSPNDQDTFDY